MPQQPMYPGMPNSPQTELATSIDDTQTTIEVLDGSALPDAPNICTILGGELSETILYEGKDGNTLLNVTRGFRGTARSWSQGQKVSRNWSSYDWDSVRGNVEDHETRINTAQSTADSALSAAENAQNEVDSLEQTVTAHLADAERHITNTERNNWNSKVNKSGDSMTGNLTFAHGTGLQGKHVNGNQLTYFELVNFPDLTTESGIVRLFRFTNTTGEKRIELYPGDGTGSIQFGLVNGEVRYLNGMNLKITAGNGNPEGSVTANPGSIYLDRTNGKMYVKETGTGNTGWKVVQTV